MKLKRHSEKIILCKWRLLQLVFQPKPTSVKGHCIIIYLIKTSLSVVKLDNFNFHNRTERVFFIVRKHEFDNPETTQTIIILKHVIEACKDIFFLYFRI